MANSIHLGRNAERLSGSEFFGAIFRFGACLLYAAMLCFAYEVLSQRWAYFGFTYRLIDSELLYPACVFAAIPAILLKQRPGTFAEGAAWFLYIFVYIPSLIVPVMQFPSEIGDTLDTYGMTFAGSVIFLAISRGEVSRIKINAITPKLFWGSLAAFWAILMIIIGYAFREKINFVGVSDIYVQRFAASEISNVVTRYSLALMTSSINPFIIAVGLYARKYWLVVIGVATQIFLFGTFAAKGVLLSPLFVISVYFMFDKCGKMRGNLFIIAVLFIVSATFPFLFSYRPMGGGINDLITLIYLRTLLISGAMFGVYQKIFATFPLTYYSDHSIISSFIQYPYGDLSVGQVVSLYLIPSADRNISEYNASFLATDGIAALGLGGVPIASAATALILRFMSRFIPPERTVLMVAVGTSFILSLANTSLLTSLITGGGILAVALISLAPLSRN